MIRCGQRWTGPKNIAQVILPMICIVTDTTLMIIQRLITSLVMKKMLFGFH